MNKSKIIKIICIILFVFFILLILNIFILNKFFSGEDIDYWIIKIESSSK